MGIAAGVIYIVVVFLIMVIGHLDSKDDQELGGYLLLAGLWPLVLLVSAVYWLPKWTAQALKRFLSQERDSHAD